MRPDHHGYLGGIRAQGLGSQLLSHWPTHEAPEATAWSALVGRKVDVDDVVSVTGIADRLNLADGSSSSPATFRLLAQSRRAGPEAVACRL